MSLVVGLVGSGCGSADDGGALESPGGGRAPGGGSANDADGSPTGNGGRAGSSDGSVGAAADGGAAGSDDGATGGGMLSSPGTPRPGTAGDGAAAAGCDRDPEFQSGTQQIEVDGSTRTFILDLPDDYDPTEAYPLVFGFHGRDFTAAEFRSPSYSNLPSAAAAEAILVFPNATETGAWELESDEDVAFFDAMLDALTRGLCVDDARVFATGHSSGGYFTNVLGCRRGDVLRAIAPVAGGGPSGSGGADPDCEGPVSAWIAHSEQDETVSFSNGQGSLDYWLASDGCDESSAEPVDPEPCVAYDGCASGLAVRWCDYEGGHDWPGFAAQGIWDFFKSF